MWWRFSQICLPIESGCWWRIIVVGDGARRQSGRWIWYGVQCDFRGNLCRTFLFRCHRHGSCRTTTSASSVRSGKRSTTRRSSARRSACSRAELCLRGKSLTSLWKTLLKSQSCSLHNKTNKYIYRATISADLSPISSSFKSTSTLNLQRRWDSEL